MIGTKVQMKESNAKWYLNHPEIYYPCKTIADYDNMETEMLIHLMCCFGVPVFGRIIDKGTDCWQVKFQVGRLTTEYFIDKKYFTVVEVV